uniref:Uncharacterized protein n=1 Tax=Oryza meridionalis TaxID=40149 RepID=A0A0E0FC39_9ORYZ
MGGKPASSRLQPLPDCRLPPSSSSELPSPNQIRDIRTSSGGEAKLEEGNDMAYLEIGGWERPHGDGQSERRPRRAGESKDGDRG